MTGSDSIDVCGSFGDFDLIATCAFGLESVVQRELENLRIDSSIGESGRVHFKGNYETIVQTNLWLRVADRILIRVVEFPAADFDALFDSVRAVAWGQLLPVDAAFPVTGRSIKSKLSSVPACQRSVKRAVVDALKRDHNSKSLAESGPLYKIDIALLKDIATLTIDTTGRSLHRRGYRTYVSKAPLKETLAAALVLLSYWKPGRPLLDPFCGSGTIPIEAARIGRNLAPGLGRQFDCQAWRDVPDELCEDLLSTARNQSVSKLEQRIHASDIDGRILKRARDNAFQAGVENDIHFEAKSFDRITTRRRFGCLITNPPYGERIGAPTHDGESRTQQRAHTRHTRELDELYGSLPNVLRKLPTWSHYVLTAYPRFESLVGRTADRRRKLYNGRIQCTFYQFHGPKPVEDARSNSQEGTETDQTEKPYVHAVGGSAFGELDAKADEQAQLFASRLTKRARHLRRWPTRRGITCFRLYERDIPEIPLVVDRYEDHLHITEYERPHDRDPAQHANWLEYMAETAGKTLDIPSKNIHLKTRLRQKGKKQHERQANTNQRIVVNEGGLKFFVNLEDYVDTGLFLDHRTTRQMVGDSAGAKSFLNLFAYTGSFTVYAAAGGAAKTTSVDLSKTYLDWAWENMRLNDFTENHHKYVASDVTEFIQTHPQEETYDLVVFDPPTFSNSKRTDQDWDVQRDAVPLLNNLMPLVREGGVIYFSNNFRRFKIDESELQASAVHEISKQTVPEDFRNRRIHRCWRIVK